MNDGIEIRESRREDLAALEVLHPAAFPDEDLLPLVRDLVGAGGDVLSLVAIADGELVGHVAFTRCGVAGRTERIDLLGPLAVAPARQRRGIGAALVGEGLRRLKDDGGSLVLVAGDPAYYARFGFVPEERVVPPYPLPEEWRGGWRSVGFGEIEPPLEGVLEVPPLWMRPALWAP
ncbi:MAG: N-acetyltransferase [Siculibacillus sp.]|nr:N-acetyltransferase [Siculibacillus sp.]